MSKKKWLFDFIKSMSKGEKSAFKQSIRDKKSDYAKLYELISKQNTYDEGALKKELGIPDNTNQFSVLKKYLHKQLLENTSQYYADDVSQIRAQINMCIILIRKQLFEQAIIKIEKTKEQVIEYELFHDHLELLELERIYYLKQFRAVDDQLKVDQLNNNLQRIAAEKQNLFQIIANYNEYQKLRDAVTIKYGVRGIAPSKTEMADIDNLLSNPLLKDNVQTQSVKASFLYWWTKRDITILKRDIPRVREIIEEMHEIRKTTPQIFERDQYTRIKDLYDKIFVDSYLGNIKDAQAQIQELSKIELKFEYEIYVRNIHWATLVIFFHLSMVDTDVPKQALLKAKQVIVNPKYSVQLKRQNFILIYFLIKLNLIKETYSEVLALNEKLDDFATNGLDQAMHYAGKFFHLVANYELQNLQFIPYLMRNLTRQISKNRKPRKIETMIFSLFSKLVKTPESDKKELFQKHLDILNSKSDEFQTLQEEYYLLDFFEYGLWLESKVSGVPFVQLLREAASAKYEYQT